MATRSLVVSGSNDSSDLMIKPAKVYLCLNPVDPETDVYTHVGYTSEEVTVAIKREFATLMQDGVKAESAVISKEMSLTFELKQSLNPDYLAIALGVNEINQDAGVTYDQVDILAQEDGSGSYYSWKITTETYDGRDVEAVVYKGEITEVSDITLGVASGNTDFSGLEIKVDALLFDDNGVGKLGHIRIDIA
jgi:hypothetical protein